MKQKVLRFLAQLPEDKYEQFNEAVSLYRSAPNKLLGVERMLNASGFSDDRLETVLYELKKAYEITDLEVHELKDLQENPLLVAGTGEGETGEGGTDTVIAERKTFRDEFPFLDHADCPNELKILVADKITAYTKMVEAHNALKLAKETNAPDEQVAALSEQVIAYEKENQSIYAELDHYGKTKTILGEHPIFEDLALKREVDAMTSDELFKFRNSSAKFFSTNKTTLEKLAPDSEKAATIKAKIEQRERKLTLVNKRIDGLTP